MIAKKFIFLCFYFSQVKPQFQEILRLSEENVGKSFSAKQMFISFMPIIGGVQMQSQLIYTSCLETEKGCWPFLLSFSLSNSRYFYFVLAYRGFTGLFLQVFNFVFKTFYPQMYKEITFFVHFVHIYFHTNATQSFHCSVFVLLLDASAGNGILTKATVPIYATGVLTCYNQVTKLQLSDFNQ